MTEENYQYRTSQTMLRNQFEGEGFLHEGLSGNAAQNRTGADHLLQYPVPGNGRAHCICGLRTILLEIPGEGM